MGLTACGDSGASPNDDDGAAAVVASFTLPVGELSSLALRTIDGKQQLCGVGDGSSKIVLAEVGPTGDLGTVQAVDLEALVGKSSSTQWEGVAADGSGNVFIVQESGRVLALGPTLDALLGVIDLPASKGNAGVEGLLLLSNGHLLVVNEKDPASLVELGPPGAVSDGIHDDLFAPATFPLPESAGFVTLASWSVALDDVSDLTVFDGKLYVVSDESSLVAEVNLPLMADDGEASLLASWKLPSEIEKPEGLVMLEGGIPLVGGDKKTGEPNLYLFESFD
jgi:uncharacterized protein YjiK